MPLGAILLLALVAFPAPAQEPPEEDEALIQKEYSFNPIQAQKEVQIGNYYFKKGSYRAAAGRFREATRWNENYAEAYFRLGETCQKMKDPAGARSAYEKFLKLEPDSKRAAQVRKLLTGKL
ncbi:MAG TPA: tetratricopeptide repeat protein [Bryobacteraceae bacterium]|nr:tetratricopeptide repeat protein [Bryobacteraceae bacterium]